jgi:molybdopterin-containing oxidoreductase family iron-sulfur binding subunit
VSLLIEGKSIMKNNNTYWRGADELNQTPEFVEKANAEFAQFLPMSESNPSEGDAEDNSRRDFLKLMGFGFAAATLIACETPVKKIIPYVNKPVEIEPGRANYYASTYVNGSEYASITVRTREGRPIKIEGNSLSTVTKSGINAQVHASVLSLYDIARRKRFSINGKDALRKTVDKEVVKALQTSGKIAIVSESMYSPSIQSAIQEFKEVYPGTEHIQYDPVSANGITSAYGGYFPNYDFSKAEVVVGVGADFLDTWGLTMANTKGYAVQRKVRRGENAKSSMNLHYQFESAMTLTGSNADKRIPIKPSEEGLYVANLYNEIASLKGLDKIRGVQPVEFSDKVKKAAKSLIGSLSKSLVVAGSNDVDVQVIVKKINSVLNNEGNTVQLDNPILTFKGDDKGMASFINKVASYDAVIFYECNPVYNHPKGQDLKKVLGKVKTSIAISDRFDETSKLVSYHAPCTHSFEHWGDAKPTANDYSVIQPTITPIFENEKLGFECRSGLGSILAWSGNKSSTYDYIKSFWKKNIYNEELASKYGSFDLMWTEFLKAGVISTSSSEKFGNTDVSSEDLQLSYTRVKKASEKSLGIELFVYANSSVGNGHFANNPWLQEVPDNISKVCWDNYAAVSPIDMRGDGLVKGGLEQGDVLSLTLGNAVAKLPVVVQPGQKAGVISVALGYGRTDAGQLASGLNEEHKMNSEGVLAIGSDVYDFIACGESTNSYGLSGVIVEKTGETRRIAQTQTHHTIMGRDIVREATLTEYQEGEDNFSKTMHDRYQIMIATSNGEQVPNTVDIWAEDDAAPRTDKEGNPQEVVTHVYPNHHWGMVIDMNTCIGCSACIVSCQAENNIPVVGKDEVIRRREMHWIRIDRYYSSEPEEMEEGQTVEEKRAELDDLKWSVSGNKALEKPSDYPTRVTFQPIMCQHCNHATCETVCPVIATSHSSEGLNQMTYNRCIGTRYCANNCAYKVRRFNWFNYSDSRDSGREFMGVNTPMNDDLAKMVLNPDVMVRARGVIEKCSMCVQRIQEGKLSAKLSKKALEDGDINLACSNSCPSDCMTFGDMNDPNSKVSKLLAIEGADRKYHVLEELNVKPNVSYLTKIRNI